MKPFTVLTGIAAPLNLLNIDTDMIIPKQHLKTIKRTGLGKVLFDEMRFTQDGAEVADFVLNKAPYRNAQILVTGANFGCGSSREHAPWALLDFGITCVIAPSFADIFYNNCFQNGILPIVVPQADVDALMKEAATGNPNFTIDLPEQIIRTSTNFTVRFDIDEYKKHCLINGLDQVGITLTKAAAISTFESQMAHSRAWV